MKVTILSGILALFAGWFVGSLAPAGFEALFSAAGFAAGLYVANRIGF